MRPLLIIRAEPGASETTARALTLGLRPVSVPLFEAQPIAWEPPSPLAFDAVMLTSAHAPRLGGARQSAFWHLPCYAVGEATSAAARGAGYDDVRTGCADGKALIRQAEVDGFRRLLHLCARDRGDYAGALPTIVHCPVYAYEGVAALPDAAVTAIQHTPLVLLHSPRSAAHFAHLCEQAGVDRSRIDLAAISPAAAQAAGEGWARVSAAAAPRDEALLELAAKLCKTGAS